MRIRIPHNSPSVKTSRSELRHSLSQVSLLIHGSFEDAAEKLTEIALIDATLNHQALFIHRLVQDAFDKSLDALSRQEYFNCAVMLVYNAFPQQVQGRPLHLQWAECEKYIQHVKHLTDSYRDSQSTRRRLTAPANFTELLKSCAW